MNLRKILQEMFAIFIWSEELRDFIHGFLTGFLILIFFSIFYFFAPADCLAPTLDATSCLFP